MDLLITVLSLLVAIYTVLPRERRLDLGLRFGLIDGAIFAAGVLLVAYFDLYSFFKAHRFVVPLPRWSVGLTPVQAAHVVLLVMLSCLALRSRFAKLSARRIDEFQQLANELLWSEKIGELLTLFDAHAIRLFQIANTAGALQQFRRTYAPRTTFEHLISSEGSKPKNSFERFISRALFPLANRVPEQSRAQGTASEILRTILESQRLVSAMARSRPYLALSIISNLGTRGSKFFRDDFISLYFNALMSDHSSVFYAEVADSRNSNGSHRYRIPSTARLLKFLFADAHVAQDLEVYRPVGNFMLQRLDDLYRMGRSDPNNLAHEGDDEMRRMQSPLFAGLHFFDVMVSEALYQNITWHMWLYYVKSFVKSVVRNYQPADDPLIDDSREFPIVYSRFLYEIFSAVGNWILAIEDLPANQENAQLDRRFATHQNDNIVKSSILALGGCVRDVLTADNIHPQTVNAVMSVTFRTYFDLRLRREDYAEVFRNALLNGGFENGRPGLEYRDRLRASLQMRDRLDYRSSDFDELVAALR